MLLMYEAKLKLSSQSRNFNAELKL